MDQEGTLIFTLALDGNGQGTAADVVVGMGSSFPLSSAQEGSAIVAGSCTGPATIAGSSNRSGLCWVNGIVAKACRCFLLGLALLSSTVLLADADAARVLVWGDSSRSIHWSPRCSKSHTKLSAARGAGKASWSSGAATRGMATMTTRMRELQH